MNKLWIAKLVYYYGNFWTDAYSKEEFYERYEAVICGVLECNNGSDEVKEILDLIEEHYWSD